MKKGLIISVASFALAAMPIMGVFAADPSAVVDNLSVTVDEICTFTRTTGNGNYTNTMAASAVNNSFGTSTFTAVCNAGSGYTVAAVFTALTGSVSGSIPYAASAPSAGTNRWTAVKGASSSTTYIAASNGTLMDTSGPDTSTGTVQQVSYKVSTASNIAQGSYTGTATYTLSQK